MDDRSPGRVRGWRWYSAIFLLVVVLVIAGVAANEAGVALGLSPNLAWWLGGIVAIALFKFALAWLNAPSRRD
jgi:hypothetical protein